MFDHITSSYHQQNVYKYFDLIADHITSLYYPIVVFDCAVLTNPRNDLI
jgi:hypothetical protein